MKVHPEFRKTLLAEMAYGAVSSLFSIGGACFIAYQIGLYELTMIFVSSLFMFGCLLIGMAGTNSLRTAIPFYRSLTNLIEKNIDIEEMALIVGVESFSNEGGTYYCDHVELRFLEDDPSEPPAIRFTAPNHQPWTKEIIPGTKVKVYGARRNRGPVLIETDKGFIWPGSLESINRRGEVPQYVVQLFRIYK